jgi:hypothetical protein
LLRVRLVTQDAVAIAPNVRRPMGIQLWQPRLLDTVSGLDYGDPLETVRPLRLIGCHNGSFTAQLVVSPTEAIAGLKVSASPLTSAGARARRGPQAAGEAKLVGRCRDRHCLRFRPHAR